MSESVAAGSFGELWRELDCRLAEGRTTGSRTEAERRTAGTGTVASRRTASTGRAVEQHPQAPAAVKGFHSPQGRLGSGRFGLLRVDSPGDVEPSQDIVWDCTSPNAGPRNTRVVEISDIVNRIAPKEGKQQHSSDPPPWWIGDGTVASTPDGPRARVRKKSSRQSSVDDLLKLARQFDENMQQDRETGQQQQPPSQTEEQRGSTWSDGVEEELQALFDCSTQTLSGRLSPSWSGSSLEPRGTPGAAPRALNPGLGLRSSHEAELTEPQPSGTTGAGLLAAQNRGSIRSGSEYFDDDWEDDDLLNDPNVIAMTQNPLQEQLGVKTQSNTKTTGGSSRNSCVVQNSNSNSRLRPSCSRSRPSGIQQLCPQLKTTNRSTFRLGPTPQHQTTPFSSTTFTAIQSKALLPDLESSTEEPVAAAADAPAAAPLVQTAAGNGAAPNSAPGMWDSPWDCGEDDQLLYQACDTLERSCDVQAEGGRSSSSSSTRTPPMEAAEANQQSACSRLVRSNSLPGTLGSSLPPVGGAGGGAPLSQSLPGTHMAARPLGRWSNTTGTSGSWNPRPACKRSGSQLDADSSKVFVSGQLKVKCSAAEIEKKKQEALARRRLRMQNQP